MNYAITKHDKYSLLKLTPGAFEGSNLETLKNDCSKLLEGKPYLVFNCAELPDLGPAMESFFTSIAEKAATAGGSVILTDLQDDMMEKMEDKGVNCVPTDDEAADFIFMEQIESEFFGEEE
ncbi:MAG TPA: hypothetical protein VEC12_15855 [Bacteroidia bacterium]|nr:hypothetical protein [Bacteroidia bacterium]